MASSDFDKSSTMTDSSQPTGGGESDSNFSKFARIAFPLTRYKPGLLTILGITLAIASMFPFDARTRIYIAVPAAIVFIVSEEVEFYFHRSELDSKDAS